MSFAYFLSLENRPGENRRLPDGAPAAIRALVAPIAGLQQALIFTPESARDQFNDDGASPPLALQLYFAELPDLEAAVAADGPLAPLVGTGLLGDVGGALVTQQAFYVRPFAVDDPVVRVGASGLPCSYVVHYPGPAADINAWLSHYIAGHPPIMRRFPGIRAIEILSRVDWCGSLPWPRAHHIQRNRVMFDSAEALTAALQSPVRLEMRADFATFPAYEGGNFHYPMATEEVLPITSSAPAGRA
jgi:hypothetical protein